MSSTENRLPRKTVTGVAETINARLQSCTLEATIAGSLRREKETVGDVEIVCAYRTRPGLFGDEVDYEGVDAELLRMERDGLITPDAEVKRNGRYYKRFTVPALGGMPLDIFLAEQGNYGAILLIRTGPGDFSKRMMTDESYGGCMPFGMRQKDGWLWQYGEKMPTPTEESYFAALGMAWIPPKKRN